MPYWQVRAEAGDGDGQQARVLTFGVLAGGGGEARQQAFGLLPDSFLYPELRLDVIMIPER